jgi:hypothetical protein
VREEVYEDGFIRTLVGGASEAGHQIHCVWCMVYGAW